MITTPEIICDLFCFLVKDQIERIQLVNQFWNNVAIRHKNILPLRQFDILELIYNHIYLYTTANPAEYLVSYIIKFDGTNLIKIEENVSSRYSQLTVDEVLTNLNDVVFDDIEIKYPSSENLDNLLNLMKLVTTKTGGRFRGRFGHCYAGRFGSRLNEIFDNYIIVDELDLGYCGLNSYIREDCENPEIVQLPLTPKEIRLATWKFKKNDEVLHFTCNSKLNGANRLTIYVENYANYENFIRQWFELYRTHQNPISLVGKFELRTYHDRGDSVLGAVKTLLNNTQLRVKYSLETNEFHSSSYGVTYRYVKRSCVLHETDSYALVIEMAYGEVIDMSSINASDLDQPSCDKMKWSSFCVKSL